MFISQDGTLASRVTSLVAGSKLQVAAELQAESWKIDIHNFTACGIIDPLNWKRETFGIPCCSLYHIFLS